MDLISFDKAATKLGISEADLDELVDSGVLTVHRDRGDVWLDSAEVAARVSESRAPAKEPKERRAADGAGPRVARIRQWRELGEREVTPARAAELLEISRRQVYHLLTEGRLNGEKRRGRRWIDLMEVELYAMSQEHWERMDGAWTAYGKQARKEAHAGLSLVAAAQERESGGASPEVVIGGERRLTLAEAAQMLALSKPTVCRMAQSGKLPFERVKRFDPETSRRRATREVLLFRLADVLAAADARERKEWKRTIPAERWTCKTSGKPFLRTDIVAPPDDVLISVAEAATMLGVCKPSISNLVRRGRLFGWQTHPGRHGSKMWLSGSQVQRYSRDAGRLRRREALARGRRGPSPIGQETNDELWRQEVGLADGVELSVRTTLEREYGEFFNSGQAAKVLGASKAAVGALRERGRLSGYQKPRTKKDGGGYKWWFYRKDDVYNLLADGEYLRNRDRGRRAKLGSAAWEAPNMAVGWERGEG